MFSELINLKLKALRRRTRNSGKENGKGKVSKEKMFEFLKYHHPELENIGSSPFAPALPFFYDERDEEMYSYALERLSELYINKGDIPRVMELLYFMREDIELLHKVIPRLVDKYLHPSERIDPLVKLILDPVEEIAEISSRVIFSRLTDGTDKLHPGVKKFLLTMVLLKLDRFEEIDWNDDRTLRTVVQMLDDLDEERVKKSVEYLVKAYVKRMEWENLEELFTMWRHDMKGTYPYELVRETSARTFLDILKERKFELCGRTINFDPFFVPPYLLNMAYARYPIS